MFPLSRLATRSESEKFFFAHPIAQHLTLHGLTLEVLAAEWGCSLEVLAQIRLCRTPVTDADFTAISDKFGVPVRHLRSVISSGTPAQPR